MLFALVGIDRENGSLGASERPGGGTPDPVSLARETMSAETSVELSSTERTERRARWEAFDFRVPCQGRVLVTNRSYGDDEAENHQYVVTVANGDAVTCTCPADEYRPGPCKHRIAVEAQDAVMLAASDDRDREGR